MSTPLIVLAAILAVFAFILIPLMMVGSASRQNRGNDPERRQPQGSHGGSPRKRKKRHSKRPSG